MFTIRRHLIAALLMLSTATFVLPQILLDFPIYNLQCIIAEQEHSRFVNYILNVPHENLF